MTPTSAQLTWTQPSIKNPVNRYEIRIRVLGNPTERMRTYTTETTEYLLSNLKADTSYRISVYAYFGSQPSQKPASVTLKTPTSGRSSFGKKAQVKNNHLLTNSNINTEGRGKNTNVLSYVTDVENLKRRDTVDEFGVKSKAKTGENGVYKKTSRRGYFYKRNKSRKQKLMNLSYKPTRRYRSAPQKILLIGNNLKTA